MKSIREIKNCLRETNELIKYEDHEDDSYQYGWKEALEWVLD